CPVLLRASTEMSEWIRFFTAAGIPPGPAAKYAVVFLDNRIQKSMLMDLTKEYLKEMGIGIMGDVIAILKYAKTAHVMYENEKPAITSLSTDPDAKVEVKRQTTPGSRMLEHYMRKEGIMESSSSKVTVSPSMAVRLGAVPTGGEYKNTEKKTKKGSVGLADTAEVVPIKRPRMVKPEEEGKYIVSMPKGSTPRTQKILEQKRQQQQGSVDEKKSSVFARLGSGNSPTPTQSTSKQVRASSSLAASSPSVFNRLGGQRQRSLSDGSDGGSVVEYQGVLKTLSSPDAQTTTLKTSTAKLVKPTSVKVTLGALRKSAPSPAVTLKSRTKSSTPGAGSIGSPPQSLMARLGAPVNKTKGAMGTAVGTKQKVTVTIGGAKRLNPGAPKQTVMDRLGVQKAEVSTTTHMDAVGVKSKVLDRLGSSDLAVSGKGTTSAGTGKPAIKRSMQVRLGAPAAATASSNLAQETSTMKQTVTVTLGGRPGSMKNRLTLQTPQKVAPSPRVGSRATPTEGSRLLKRLGTSPMASSIPTKKSSVQDRLGVMKAEVSSTTPSVTVTLGGGALKKMPTTAAAGGPSKTNVFSRLGS
ncbi:uncharacterized protein C19orf47-like, partial [Diadema antillarum]|uniref:uncharacterized protein C19orf47-like n=1 Tax=Diadema antillarum TaxID=105358 RepID=UPI003A87A1E7